MAAVLITGGAGFIGSGLARKLAARGTRVRVLDVLDPQIHGRDARAPDFGHPAIEFVAGDVRQPDDVERALAGVDAVFHFAASTGVGQSMYAMRSYVDTNCAGTAALLDAVVQHRPRLKRLVLASSRAVYGEGAHVCDRCGPVCAGRRLREHLERGWFGVYCPRCGSEARAMPTAEDQAAAPASIYGWTKLAQEELCRQAARAFNLPVVCLRFFNVYGSGQSLRNPYTGVVSVFYNRLLSGEPIALYENGLAGRDFVHVSDVVSANVQALEADVPPGTCLNVGAGTEHTILDVARGLARACGKALKTEDRGEFRLGDIRSCFADLSQARRLLGYQPQVTLEAGLAEFAAWAQTQPAVDLYDQAAAELRRYDLLGGARPQRSAA